MDLISAKKTLKIGNKIFSLHDKMIMGILNITPDSFYSGSRITEVNNLLTKAEKMISEGADIIDIGGYSSRPGAEDIDIREEKSRILEPLENIRKAFPEIIISVDTFRPEIAKIAIESGVDIINDISAGGEDEKMFEIVSKYQIPYIIMHMKGTPQTMQSLAKYTDITKEVLQFFANKINTLNQLGVNDVIIDPGFGFAKTIQHNYELLNNLSLFKFFNLPVLAGLSRKAMIYRTLNTTPEDALNGTTVLNMLALINGADILRVHDVKEANETLKLMKIYSKLRKFQS